MLGFVVGVERLIIRIKLLKGMVSVRRSVNRFIIELLKLIETALLIQPGDKKS